MKSNILLLKFMKVVIDYIIQNGFYLNNDAQNLRKELENLTKGA